MVDLGRQEEQTIMVPGWRYVSSDDSATTASDCTESTKAGSITDVLSYEPPYQRWIQKSPEGLEQRQEYMLDDDDVDWLEKKGVRLRFPGRSLFCQGIVEMNCVRIVVPFAIQICEEHFESIVDVLEKHHYEQLLSNRSMFQTKLSSGEK